MILVIVGTLGLPFDRLIRTMDRLAPELDEKVVIQTGASDYEPANAEWFKFESEERINQLYDECSLLVCHAGAGTILSGLARGKPIVMVPRRKSENEVTNDHQLLLVRKMEEMGKAIGVLDINDLRGAIARARESSHGSMAQDRSLTENLSSVIRERERKRLSR